MDNDWNYQEKHVAISMLKCIKEALQKLKHFVYKPAYFLVTHVVPSYGAKIQHIKQEDEIKPVLPINGIKHAQHAVGVS